MNLKKSVFTFIATDFGAYWYHRCLHSFESTSHIEHHRHPHNSTVLLRASMVSGTVAILISKICLFVTLLLPSKHLQCFLYFRIATEFHLNEIIRTECLWREKGWGGDTK